MNKYVAITALVFSAAALAQELPAFEEVDKNADGAIDRNEAAAVEGLDFATADANQDGRIDRAEYAAVSE
jgi:hypothetical protein